MQMIHSPTDTQVAPHTKVHLKSIFCHLQRNLTPLRGNPYAHSQPKTLMLPILWYILRACFGTLRKPSHPFTTPPPCFLKDIHTSCSPCCGISEGHVLRLHEHPHTDSPPKTVIQEGTHIFVPYTIHTQVCLNGMLCDFAKVLTPIHGRKP